MSIRDFNILSSKNDTFNLNNTFMSGALTKYASDKPMFNVNKLRSIVIESGEPNNNDMISYDSSIGDWTYITATGSTGFIYSVGYTGSSGNNLLENVGYVATDTVNTNADYTTVSDAVNGLGTNADAYFIKIIGDTTDTSLAPSWKSSTDYHIKINKAATWYLNISSGITGPSNGNLLISGPGTINITVFDNSSIVGIFNLSSGYTLTFKNLNIVIPPSGVGVITYRTIVNSSSNLVIENCTTTITVDRISFRRTTSGPFGNTIMNQSTFNFTGCLSEFIYNQNVTDSGILDINNCEYNGGLANPNFISYDYGTCSIKNVLFYFDSGISQNDLQIRYNKCLINNFMDFSNNLNYIDLYITSSNKVLLFNTSIKGEMIVSLCTIPILSNIYSEYDLSLESDECVITNLKFDYIYNRGNSNIYTNIYTYFFNTNSPYNNTLVKNMITNFCSIRGENSQIYNSSIVSIASTLNTPQKFVINNSTVNSSINLGLQMNEATISTCKFYYPVYFSCSSITAVNNVFSNSIDTYYNGARAYGGNRFEDYFAFGLGTTGPLVTGNLGIPLTGPSGSIPSSIANSYIL